MVYTANWGIICHLPPFTGTRNNHSLVDLFFSASKPSFSSTSSDPKNHPNQSGGSQHVSSLMNWRESRAWGPGIWCLYFFDRNPYKPISAQWNDMRIFRNLAAISMKTPLYGQNQNLGHVACQKLCGWLLCRSFLPLLSSFDFPAMSEKGR